MHRLQNPGRDSRKTTRLIILTQPIYTGRFAPSPTGPLHLGSLYTALASYLDARHHQGLWLLRIDDIDTARNQPGAVDSILTCLDFFQLHWDGVVDYQNHHLEAYQAALNRLIADDHVYACDCSRKDRLPQSAVYPQICRNKSLPIKNEVALRLKTTNQDTHFHDAIQGAFHCRLESEQGDFVIKRKDGLFAYQLAVVIDDYRQGITDVVRGADLLDSTPRQVYLQQLLGYPQPAYSHIPVIVDTEGHKLSKQTGAQAVELKDAPTTLFKLLQMLKQQPPEGLQNASVPEVLTWAIAHWDKSALAPTTCMPLTLS